LSTRFRLDNKASRADFDFGFTPFLLNDLTRGAVADVFAAGNTGDMDKAAQAGLLADAPVRFATNTMAIVVAPGNPKKVASFRDLNRADLKVAVCIKQLKEPGTQAVGGAFCGTAIDKIEQAAGVRLNHPVEVPRSEDVLQKVINGDVDAGVAYVSDAFAGGSRVTRVPFPEATQAIVSYWIAVLKESKHPELARKFVDLVTGPIGQEMLGENGFAAP